MESNVYFKSVREVFESKDFQKGSFCSITYKCEPNMNKRNNPFYGKVEKVILYGGVGIGVDYAKAMENAAKRSGNIDCGSYEVEKKDNGKGSWINERLTNVMSVNDKGTEYLRLYIYKKSTKKVTYLFTTEENVVEVVDINHPLFTEISSWDKSMQKKKEACNKQREFGISDYEVPLINDLIASKILEVSNGDRKYIIEV